MNPACPRLLHVMDFDGPGGGPQSLITQLETLKHRYVQSVAYGGKGRLAAYCEEHKIPHYQLLFHRKWLLWIGALQLWFTLIRLRPDILILHSPMTGALGAVLGWMARVPRRVYIARWPTFYANFDLLRCIRNHAAQYFVCRFSHRIICLTESSRYQYLIRRAAPDERFVVVPNAMTFAGAPKPERVEALRKQYGFDRHTYNVVSIGRLYEQKRIDWLLTSWQRVIQSEPNAHLWIVGHGPKRDEWHRLAESLQIQERITWIEKQDFTGAEFIAAGDIFVHTALFETFGNVILEAMQAGIPITATDVDGPKNIVTNDHEGFLTPPGDPDAFADALLRLMAQPELRKRFGQAGLETSRHYLPERIAPRLLAALEFKAGE